MTCQQLVLDSVKFNTNCFTASVLYTCNYAMLKIMRLQLFDDFVNMAIGHYYASFNNTTGTTKTFTVFLFPVQ